MAFALKKAAVMNRPRLTCLAIFALVVLILGGSSGRTEAALGAGVTAPLDTTRPIERTKGPARPSFDRDTVVIRFRSGVERAARTTTAREHRVDLVRTIGRTGFLLASVRERALETVLTSLRQDPRIASAQPNYIRTAAAEPNDPRFEKNSQEYLENIRVPAAWDVSRGDASMRIAILDTGIDIDHPDLVERIIPGRNVIAGNSAVADDNGHGTQVAGVAAADTNNGQGVAGVAWGASILPVKVLDADGTGTDANIAAGITWAADHGAHVINLSLAGYGRSDVLERAIDYALARNAVVVAAAGGGGNTEPVYPAAYPNVLAVAATDWDGNVAWISSHGDWIDVAAPGWMITTTRLFEGPLGLYWGGLYSGRGGTSYAAAVVSGIALLVRSNNPTASATTIANQIASTARDAGPPGDDPFYGRGLVDAYRALGGPAPPALAPPAGDGYEPNDSRDQATPISANDVVFFSTHSPEGDVDWFSVDLSQGTWNFLVQPENYRDPRPLGLDTVLELYSSNGQLLQRVDDRGVDGLETDYIEIGAAGRYYIRISNYVGSRSAGTYGLRVSYAWASSSELSLFEAHSDRAPSSEPTAVAVEADTTPPDTKIHYAPIGTTTPGIEQRFDFYSTEPGSRFECLGGGAKAWFPCQVPFGMGGRNEEGTFTFSIRAIDGAGNIDPTPAVAQWTQKNGAPANDSWRDAQPIAGESGSVQGSNRSGWYDMVDFSLDNRGGMSIWYRWIAPASGIASFETVGSDFDTLLVAYSGTSTSLSRLLVGDDDSAGQRKSRMQFQVAEGTTYYIGVDGFTYGLYAANGSVVLNWSLRTGDVIPPETTIDAGPSGATRETSATLFFSSSEPGSSFECSLDGAAFAACTSPQIYPGLIEGPHGFRVRAIDQAGNADATPAARTWTVDTTPPETTIDAGPSGQTSETGATFAFSSSEAASTFECALDGAAWEACTSPKSYAGLLAGERSFAVRASDRAGNADTTPATRVWTVVAQKAATTITGTAGNDVLAGTAGDDIIYGYGGDDDINGGGGNDLIYGGAGDDRLSGNAGADLLLGESGHDRLGGGMGSDREAGGEGSDVFLQGSTRNGGDTVNGGRGSDTVSYVGRATSLRISLDWRRDDGALGEGDLIRPDVEHVVGGSGEDRLIGNGRANVLSGGKGPDVLFGRGAGDTLLAGRGRDTIYARGDGFSDLAHGGTGIDRATVDPIDERRSIERLL
jgi:hypothetical protein